MKTVKDFKDAGLEIIGDDIIDVFTGDSKSASISIALATKYSCDPIGAWTIREFAWRKNTGNKPLFTGLVEWSNGEGYCAEVDMKDLNWNSTVQAWRPLLNQSVIAPSEAKLASKATKLEVESKVDYTSLEFWKDAPEGRNFLLVNKEKGLCEFYYQMPVSDGGKGNSECWANFENEVLNLMSKWELIERPQPKPVYTQEMYDKGELPPVGSMYLDDDNQLCECFATRSNFVVGEMVEHLSTATTLAASITSVRDIKPIDTRTDEEKAFDSFLDSNYNMKRSDFSQSQDDKDFIEGVYLAFKAGVTWSKGNE